MLFFRPCDLQASVKALEQSSSSFSLHLKLSPNICYSKRNRKLMTLPKFEPESSADLTSQLALSRESSHDTTGMSAAAASTTSSLQQSLKLKD